MKLISRNRFRLDNGNEIQVTGHLAFDLFSPDGQLIGSCRNSLTGWKRFFHVRPVFKNATGTVLAHAELPLIDSGRFTLILPEGQRIDLPHETPLPDSLNDELKLIVSAFRQNSLGTSAPDDCGDD